MSAALLGAGVSQADLAQVRAALITGGQVWGSDTLQQATRVAHAELHGAGPLQPLLDLPGVTDVLVNGPQEVWFDRGAGLERSSIHLGAASAVRALAGRLAALAGQRLDDAAPICDGSLRDGTRLHAVVDPLVSQGAVISLRVLRQAALTFDALVASQMFPSQWVELLRAVVAGRANILIAGGTGTGKTTLMAALLGLISPDERLVTVEEARELSPAHPHVVPLVTRRANVEGAGAVDMVELVRAALRMRPDRIVVGECRGAEVREVLLAMNTGHDGAMATVHANAAEHVPARLEALGALGGMSREAVAAQTEAAVDVVIHVRRAAVGAGAGVADAGVADASASQADAAGGGAPVAMSRYISAIGVTKRRGSELDVVPVARWTGPGSLPTIVDQLLWEGLCQRWMP